MKFIIDSDNKSITLLNKISLKEIEQLKIWLGTEWESWTIDAKERILEQDKWLPLPVQPFPVFPPVYPPLYPTPMPSYPLQPFYTTCLHNESQLMVECKEIKELASYDSVIYAVNTFVKEKATT